MTVHTFCVLHASCAGYHVLRMAFFDYSISFLLGVLMRDPVRFSSLQSLILRFRHPTRMVMTLALNIQFGEGVL
jgi:hypothetical protein